MCDGHVHHELHPVRGPGQVNVPAAHDFRVVMTGKGGVGKTSITALLGLLLARRGYTVLALDADPQMNLPYALGMPAQQAGKLVPLSENADYVEEKTGARPGQGWGLFFRLNPDVDDVVRRFGVMGPGGVRLVVMGNTVQPAAGCLCPENALLASVVNAIGLRRGEAILMDTQAGFEHFGRALAKGFGHAVVVSDTTFNGLQAALAAARLAQRLDLGAIHLAVNGVRDGADFQRTLDRLAQAGGFGFTSVHSLPFEPRLALLEPTVAALLEEPRTPLLAALDHLLDQLAAGTTRALPCAS